MISPEQRKVCVIGVGNEYRGDDAIGLLVIRKLMDKVMPSTALIEMDGEAAKLIDAMKGRSAAILVDAMQSGSKAGTVSRFDAGVRALPLSFFRCSTHVVGVSEAIELARALDRLPQYVIVYGIEGRRFELGSSLSPEVSGVVAETVERIYDEIQTLRRF